MIPESSFYLEGKGGLFDFIEERLKENGHLVIVLAEGAGQEYVAADVHAANEKDASGNRLLLDVGPWLSQKIKDHFTQDRKMAVNMKYIDPTYMIRAIPSIASDNIYCTLLAHSAVHGAMAGYTGFTVGPVNSKHAYIPIARVTEKTNTVQLTDRMWARLLASTNQPSFLTSNDLTQEITVDKETFPLDFFFHFLRPQPPSSSSRATSPASSSSIDFWCNQTPHPDPCKQYFVSRTQRFRPKDDSEFTRLLVQLAMDQAQFMHKQAHEYGPKCVTKNQKCVFTDCLKLYDNTIFHLNQTLQTLNNNNESSFSLLLDAQTWLSAALTNIETCRSGAAELISGGEVFSAADDEASDGVRKMISNVLAVNHGMILRTQGEIESENARLEGNGDGFPMWFPRHERRLLRSNSGIVKANIVVAKDGSGHFTTVQAAIDAAAKRRVKTRFVIRVKRGIYEENIEVDKNNVNLMIVGDGMRVTIITSSKSTQDGLTTYSSATAGIDGPRFIARDITFRNTAGPQKGQAVALRSASDLSVFYRCGIEGYQDTLMAHAQRQFYRNCKISGTVDFIFGNAAVVLQNCLILARKPLDGQANMITAQGRGDPFQNSGISIINSQIRADPEFRPVARKFQTYLGRPWQQYARVVVMKTYIESLVSPLGWSPWGNSNFAQDTLYFGEYENTGPGSSTKGRVSWPGFHVITSPKEAEQFTVGSLLAGRTWLPSTGVPFTSGI
ncbi:putative pectinesterase/pectinesterase inhibitor 33 [Senna tora]|uniref:Putative pectinesterase/pectinesterase inhibitor 33 n=1 Tax=Senna tora TaxID=362788 RepID=A0A834X2C9_9FABA|nr:putative pectinesterase/pectinesterase inhibitor 33 [Senna tora]